MFVPDNMPNIVFRVPEGLLFGCMEFGWLWTRMTARLLQHAKVCFSELRYTNRWVSLLIYVRLVKSDL